MTFATLPLPLDADEDEDDFFAAIVFSF